MRISVQLVKVADGYHLWSETYDRTLDDIFAVQDDIAQSVVKELRTTLLGEDADSDASGEAKAEVAKAAKGRGTDPEAHRLYLLARHLLDRGTREDTAKAIEYLKQALERDPEFALAWAELGRAYAREVGSGLGPGGGGVWARARGGGARARAGAGPGGGACADWAGSGCSTTGTGGARRRRSPGRWSWRRGMPWCSAGPACWQEPGPPRGGDRALSPGAGAGPAERAAYHNLGLALHAADRFDGGGGGVSQGAGARPAAESRRTANLALTLLAQGRGEEALAEAMREPDEAFRLWALAIVHHAMGHGRGVGRGAAGADREVRGRLRLSDRRGACGARRGGRGVRVAGARVRAARRRARRAEDQPAAPLPARRSAVGRVPEEDGARWVSRVGAGTLRGCFLPLPDRNRRAASARDGRRVHSRELRRRDNPVVAVETPNN